jgi:Fe-S-cluster containining protein
VTEPWYRGGLRFTCTQCGDCCTGAPGFVWVSDEEMTAIADHLDEPVAEARAVYSRLAARGRTLREKANGACVFYDRQRGCVVYPVRPAQCRTWPFWESNVATPGAWRKTCAVCPGSGRGELIPAEEITRRVREVRM